MGEQAKLDLDDTWEPALANVPTSGLLVTNHLNLMYMLAAGLVMPPAGFGDKYYADTLGTFPGWIPLFLDFPSKKAIELATSEADYLKPAIVRLDLSRLSGQVMAMSADGVECRDFRAGVSGAAGMILVPAPLPTSWIEFIAFRTTDEMRGCLSDCEDHHNVALREYKPNSNKDKLFTKATSDPWPLSIGAVKRRSVPLDQPISAGGIMAMLQRFANLDDQAVQAYRISFNPDIGASAPMTEDHPILAGLGTWIAKGAASLPSQLDTEQDETTQHNIFHAHLFWECIDRLVARREEEPYRSAEEVLLGHLAEVAEDPEMRSLGAVRNLKNTLDSLTGLGDASPTELFERHVAPFEHAMTLFFLRRDCTDLLEYSNDQLSDLDWLVAAILYGARDGWLELPLGIRGNRAHSDPICHRMAQMSHRLAESGTDLGEPPSRIHSLREVFGDPTGWNTRQKSAALELARIQKWNCIRTSVDLRVGEYRLVVKGGGLSIEVPGEPRITPEVDGNLFLKLLASARLDFRVEEKIRKRLGS